MPGKPALRVRCRRCRAVRASLAGVGAYWKGSDPMRDYIRNMKVSYLLAAILYVALGLVLLVWPTLTKDIICLIFGLLLVAYGLITIISFLVHDSRLGAFRFELVLGVVATAAGILFLVRPEFVTAIIPVVLGVYIIIDSLLNLKRALDLREMLYERWWVVVLLSAVSAVLGVLIVLRPGLTADALIMLIGAVFIYTGLSDLWGLFVLNRATKAFRKDHPIVVDPIDVE